MYHSDATVLQLSSIWEPYLLASLGKLIWLLTLGILCITREKLRWVTIFNFKYYSNNMNSFQVLDWITKYIFINRNVLLKYKYKRTFMESFIIDCLFFKSLRRKKILVRMYNIFGSFWSITRLRLWGCYPAKSRCKFFMENRSIVSSKAINKAFCIKRNLSATADASTPGCDIWISYRWE